MPCVPSPDATHGLLQPARGSADLRALPGVLIIPKDPWTQVPGPGGRRFAMLKWFTSVGHRGERPFAGMSRQQYEEAFVWTW